MDRRKTHKHRCPICDYIWKHRISDIVDNFLAHRCPDCRQGFDFNWYEGSKKAGSINDGDSSGTPDKDLNNNKKLKKIKKENKDYGLHR